MNVKEEEKAENPNPYPTEAKQRSKKSTICNQPTSTPNYQPLYSLTPPLTTTTSPSSRITRNLTNTIIRPNRLLKPTRLLRQRGCRNTRPHRCRRRHRPLPRLRPVRVRRDLAHRVVGGDVRVDVDVDDAFGDGDGGVAAEGCEGALCEGGAARGGVGSGVCVCAAGAGAVGGGY